MIEILYSKLNLERSKVIYFITLISEKLLILFFHFFIVNYFSSESYGILNQTNFISAFMQNILMFGVAIPFIVSVSRDKKLNKFFFNFFVPTSIIISILFFLIVIISGDQLSNILFGDIIYKNYLLVLLVIIISDILSEYIIVKHRVENQLNYHSNFILSRSVLKISILLIVYYLTNSFFISFLISSLTYFIFTLIIALIYFDLKFSTYKSILTLYSKEIKSLFFEGIQLTIIYILISASSILINILIVNEFDISTLAIYNFNFMLASAPMTILGYITFYALPDFSKKTTNSYDVRSSNIFKDILLSSIIFLLFFVIVFLSYDLITSLINEYYKNRFLFTIIFISNFIFMLNNFFQFPLLNQKNYKSLILIIFISLSLNIIYLFIIDKQFTILTPIYGFMITNISAFILLVITNFYIYHK